MLFAMLLVGVIPISTPRVTVQQEGGTWKMTFQSSSVPLAAIVDGDVSNSRLPGFSHPVVSVATWPIQSRLVWPFRHVMRENLNLKWDRGYTLSLSHNYTHNAQFEPMLGNRFLSAKCDKTFVMAFVDLSMADNQTPDFELAPVPEDYVDTQQFLTAPSSMVLDCETVGSFRFPEVPVRSNERYRVTFRYRALNGSPPLRFTMTQYHEGDVGWIVLHESYIDQEIRQSTLWRTHEMTVKINPKANTMALSFRMIGDFGTCWIDDIKVEPFHSQKKP